MIIKSGGGLVFPPAPIAMYKAGLCEFYDRGVVERSWNPAWGDPPPDVVAAGGKRRRHECQLVFQLVENSKGQKLLHDFTSEMEDDKRYAEHHGKRFEIRKLFTASLGPKSALRKMLNQWRGEPLGPDDIRKLSNPPGTDILIGQAAIVVVDSHSDPDEDGRIYPNISAILPPLVEPDSDGPGWTVGKLADVESKKAQWFEFEPVDYVKIDDRTKGDDGDEKVDTEDAGSSSGTSNNSVRW